MKRDPKGNQKYHGYFVIFSFNRLLELLSINPAGGSQNSKMIEKKKIKAFLFSQQPLMCSGLFSHRVVIATPEPGIT